MKLALLKPILFLMFLLSGFAGLLYQVIWSRLAYAAFGVMSPVLSVVISVFMLGLAIGSWIGGILAKRLQERKNAATALILSYGLTEAAIGLGAILVPYEYKWSSSLILPTGELNSVSYLLCSALAIAISLAPWCILMGATYPLVMGFIQSINKAETKGFSFLYLANVFGAIVGVSFSTFILIEVLGFKQTLLVGAVANFVVASISFCLAALANRGSIAGKQVPTENDLDSAAGSIDSHSDSNTAPQVNSGELQASPILTYGLLFLTGFISMAMEIVWTRAYAPVLGNEVYSFAGLLVSYLVATFIGSAMYRKDLAKGRLASISKLAVCLAIFALLPVLVNDPRVHIFGSALWVSLQTSISGSKIEDITKICRIASIAITLLSIVPFCAALGYLTPQLIDQASAGKPERAGTAYALNIVGCILGPLSASYLLLVALGTKASLLLVALPLIASAVILTFRSSKKRAWVLTITCLVLAWTGLTACVGYEDFIASMHPRHDIRRDYTATVIACDSGSKANLLVNGVGVTALNQCTKDMAHIPMLCHQGTPRRALTICFGMGTSFRSLMSWGIDSTAVELVPSVKELFSYFWSDAPEILKKQNGRIIVDDGRRFLNRSQKKYDVIVTDCPPPVEAAGVSLLMSKEFVSLAKQHLNSDGLMLCNIIGTDPVSAKAAINAVHSEFPFVKVIFNEASGFLCMASQQPINLESFERNAIKMPASAQKDLFEWTAYGDDSMPIEARIALYMKEQKKNIVAEEKLKEAAIITDDRPLNEYFLLRRTGIIPAQKN